MVGGALAHSRAQVALAISGIAGPDGGSLEKPVGTVCFAWGLAGQAVVTRHLLLPGDRQEVRRQAVINALNGLIELLQHD
jgi:nicotinamide-nucleotide amidase